jgi:acetolactate synthase-1/2/3 large subunit
VDCVFGVPGTQNVALYEALRRSGLRAVLATHELAASFMANGYTRASGRIAPLVTIGGPGFSYALAGLAEARHDSAALLHITGRPPAGGRKFEFQAIDHRAISAPLVKAFVSLDRPDEVADRTFEALALAREGEPGPVLLECASEALEGIPAGPAQPAPRPAAPSPPEQPIHQASALLAAARRPLLMAGQGAADAAPLVRRLAEALGAPVFTTASGRGVLPEDHPLALCFDFSRGGVDALDELVEESDCVLVLGCKLGAAGTGIFQLRLPQDRLIRVDTSPEVLAGNYPARLSICARVEGVLERLLPRLESRGAAAAGGWPAQDVARRREQLRSARDGFPPDPVVRGVTPATPAAFFAALRRALPRDGIVVSDTGLHQALVRRHFEVLTPRGLVFPSDFQSMGFGLPAAIGARLAAPGRPLVLVIGDGAFANSGMELLTAVREKIPLAVVVFNDGRLNWIRVQQLATSGMAHGVDLLNPDFALFAEAMGARYALVDGDAEEVLERAVASDEVTVVEVRLGDSGAIHLARARGLARGALRRTVGPLPRLRRWLRRK